MVDEVRERNGGCGVGLVSNGEALNGFAVEVRNGGGNSAAGLLGEGLRTYKRRKRARTSCSDSKMLEVARFSEDSSTQYSDKVGSKSPGMVTRSSCEQVSLAETRSVPVVDGSEEHSNSFLEQNSLTLSKKEGGSKACNGDANAYQAESGCAAAVKEPVQLGEDSHRCTSSNNLLPNGTHEKDNSHVIGLPNGSKRNSNNHTTTELCRRSFVGIITSEEFGQLCDLLSENFQGLKIDSFLDINHINSRMEKGAYESSPILFHSDIQQIWTKLQKIGTEMVSLSKSLSLMSRTYCERVGGSIDISENEKHEDRLISDLAAVEKHCPDMPEKRDQTEACGANKQFGEKADRKDYVVCDLCEEMYHVSCIEHPSEGIPLKNWYCSNCISMDVGSPHENCVICERLNAPKSLPIGNGESAILTNEEETPTELEETSNDFEQFKVQNSSGSKSLPCCNICRSDVKNEQDFIICGHSFCPHKFYHVACLTKRQLNAYGSCWYCPSCLCRSCLTDKDDDKIVLCDGCDHAYHIYCMQPPRTTIPRGKWFCRRCNSEIRRIRYVKMAFENKLKKRVEEGKEGVEAMLDSSGGVDMLLDAAKTLNYEENMAALGLSRR